MVTPFMQSQSPVGFGLGNSLALGSTGAVDDRMMSALPMESTAWPPVEFFPVEHLQKVWNAWWVGDRDLLAWCYYLGRST